MIVELMSTTRCTGAVEKVREDGGRRWRMVGVDPGTSTNLHNFHRRLI
jgi:hypothetical protein